MTIATATGPWTLARRTAGMQPSAIREILKLCEAPGVISLAGGLPAPEAFPAEVIRAACDKVLRDTPSQALQYASTEGFGPLCDWVAESLRASGMPVDASQVLITTGSQQGLDLVGKVLIDAGSGVAVESPTYLGALTAFAPYEPRFVGIESDEEGAVPQALAHIGSAAFAYLQPSFQNPSGRSMAAARRAAIAAAAERRGLPIVEDNPYGELWFHTPPPPPLAAHWPEGTVLLGSFSKVLAPGLRLGYVAVPKSLFPKLVHAKQAADLHTPGFNQRVVAEVLQQGFLNSHAPTLRQRYAERCEAMHLALTEHLGHCCRWVRPRGGMFFWLELPAGCDAGALLPKAVARGVAFVPGSAFFAEKPAINTLRLSFATERPENIARGIAALGAALAEMLEASNAVSAVPVGSGSDCVLTSEKSPNPFADTKLQQEYA